MRRELAKLSVSEAFDWLRDQEEEVMRAREAQTISDDVANSLLERLADELCEYLHADYLGLLKEGR